MRRRQKSYPKLFKWAYFGICIFVFIFVSVSILNFSGITNIVSDNFYTYINQDMGGEVAGESMVRIAAIDTLTPSQKLINEALNNPDTRRGGFVVLGWAFSQGNMSIRNELLSRIRDKFTINNGQISECFEAGHLWGRTINGFMVGLALAQENSEYYSMLSQSERDKIKLIAKAVLANGAYTTTPYKSGNYRKTLLGDRTFLGANYINPYAGAMMAASLILGHNEAYSFLDNYDHQQFMNELESNGFARIRDVFAKTVASEANRYINNDDLGDWYFKFPNPYPNKIYRVDFGENMYMVINHELFKGVFPHIVPTRPTKWGYMQGQPNPGQLGMIYEFHAGDGADRGDDICFDHAGFEHVPHDRDSVMYGQYSFEDTAYNRLLMMIKGYWNDQQHSVIKQNMESLQKVGGEDLFYKFDSHAYITYDKGECKQPEENYRRPFSRAIYEEISGITPCSCSSWVDDKCGDSCSPTQMRQTRDCPNDCSFELNCVSNSQCEIPAQTCSSLQGSTCPSTQYCDTDYIDSSNNTTCCPSGSCKTKTADLNCSDSSHKIGFKDLTVLIAYWGEFNEEQKNEYKTTTFYKDCEDSTPDLNGDGKVDIDDFALFLNQWGK